MSRVMVSIRSTGTPPTIQAVEQVYGLPEGALDRAFGVVEVDPEERIYTILIDAQEAAKLYSTGEWTIQGPFSNPGIAPF